MAQHIKNVPCPKCREQGNDRTGDNLAVYSDDSRYCWKCGYWSNGGLSARQFLARNNEPILKEYPRIALPIDCTIDYPDKCLNWLHPFGLTRQDMINNGVLWSVKEERLIFPFWHGEELLGWQGRYFGKDPKKIKKKKWFGRGNLQSIFHIYFLGRGVAGCHSRGKDDQERHKTSALVLVEDVISAIKVSKAGINVMPLFGVNVKSRMPQIRVLNYVGAILWLDPDQHIKMINECNRERLNGFKMHPLLTDKDPKYFTVEEIKKLLKI